MEIDELKSQVEKYREKLKEKKGHVCTFGKNGPVGMVLIDALVEILETQQQRIEALEKKASSQIEIGISPKMAAPKIHEIRPGGE